MMKMILFLLLAMLPGMIGCGSSALTRDQAAVAVLSIDESAGDNIAALDEGIRELRQQLMMLVMLQLLSAERATEANKHLMVADYFMTEAWAALVRKDKRNIEYFESGKSALKMAYDLVAEAMKADGKPGEFPEIPMIDLPSGEVRI